MSALTANLLDPYVLHKAAPIGEGSLTQDTLLRIMNRYTLFLPASEQAPVREALAMIEQHEKECIRQRTDDTTSATLFNHNFRSGFVAKQRPLDVY